ncbi:MAG: TetR/AcrR family transcriptional regulator [Pelatocladus maniniholoensis HA4357-MV3]|jgi:AcrR family transcriptional regulator|uniref:TetR/AcrR family transcriptional regulator n=1 Tax=Pelatocladus maniniholoensis HA4357-MV3 TaxID=1117104 RepID=A0A9E3H934_9NOST|nr:TetR/AcrR family transcriptional regulator [Pelatocladus maniniholoensis HA4357-MV3]BAZ67021.1 transcriptional regulator [Fischerella sp. NIES-4106]
MAPETNQIYDRILETASELFYQKGIQHVGINEVIAASDVAKRTFYKYFPSKDQLILEVMRYRKKQWLQWFQKSVEERGKTAKEKLLATFDVLGEWYAQPDFRGCPFINAVLEIADANHPAHHVSVSLRKAIRTHIMKLAIEAQIRNPEAFSQQYLLLIGGASLMATIEGTPAGAKHARQALSILIDGG